MNGYENRLIKSEWVVRPISIQTARNLIVKYHYAKSASKMAVYLFGLFNINALNEQDCKGVTWWLPPTKNTAISSFTGDFHKVLTLSRLVLAEDVPKNAASFLLSKSVKLIDTAKWECLITYADTVMNHTGTIYKASNWEYIGLTAVATPVFKNADGLIKGRKRGKVNLTVEQMNAAGYYEIGRFAKHKFRKILIA